jgi:hypothetical protein
VISTLDRRSQECPSGSGPQAARSYRSSVRFSLGLRLARKHCAKQERTRQASVLLPSTCSPHNAGQGKVRLLSESKRTIRSISRWAWTCRVQVRSTARLEILHSPQRFETPKLSHATTERPLEGKHQEAVDLSRKHYDTTAIKITGNLSYRVLDELSCVADVTGDSLCRLSGTVPDAMRRSPHVRPNRSPGVVGVFVPPKCNL